MLRLALLASWLAPVDGPVLRPFTPGPDPFAAGLHRGVDLGARSGEVVRSPCAGRVVFSGGTPRGPAVTVRCGGRRATVLPVAPAARAGATVARGAVLGRATGAELHLSARDASGYVDPAALLGAARPPTGPAGRPRTRPPSSPARRPAQRPAPEARPPEAPAPLPWTFWAGLCTLALGTAGAGARRARTRQRRSRAVPAAQRA